jgi:hypothetical protein
MVRVFIPNGAINPRQNPSLESNFNGIYANYITGLHRCSGSSLGTTLDVTLKSFPNEFPFIDDGVKTDKSHNKVLFENSRARILLVHFNPEESGPIVDKRARVIFALTNSQATVTFPDGRSEVRESKAGKVYFSEAGRQSTKNTGKTPLANIVIELKSK